VLAGLAFLAVSVANDLLLLAIDFDRYTVTPIVVVPALALAAFARLLGSVRERGWAAAASGALVVVVFTAMEAAWMAAVVGRPWPVGRVLSGLPWSLLAGVLSGYVGWVVGGFLQAIATGTAPFRAFGSVGRARAAAVSALVLAVVGLVATYRPQRFGPPMTVEELRLAPIDAFRYQEAIFWEALHQDAWSQDGPAAARSEGVIDGFPLPIGPGWCAETDTALTAEIARLRFSLEVNGVPVDLALYPMVRLRDRDGAHCAWVGVASRFQRASQNRFRYAAEVTGAGGGRDRKVVELDVVFKDP
jgi:hypothetical protein